VEIWKHFGEGLEWLADLFNVIFRTVKMPMSGELVQSSRFIRTKVIFKIVIITKALNCLATLSSSGKGSLRGN